VAVSVFTSGNPVVSAFMPPLDSLAAAAYPVEDTPPESPNLIKGTDVPFVDIPLNEMVIRFVFAGTLLKLALVPVGDILLPSIRLAMGVVLCQIEPLLTRTFPDVPAVTSAIADSVPLAAVADEATRRVFAYAVTSPPSLEVVTVLSAGEETVPVIPIPYAMIDAPFAGAEVNARVVPVTL
jgi:hypothetical protein